jgi:chromosome partitioning protein
LLYTLLMAIIIAICSQKGGVGKSTLSRLIAREYANAGWSVKIADLDVSQATSFSWQGRRLQNDIKPVIPVERFGTVEQALKFTAALDLLVIDAPPHSSAATLKIAKAANLVILPTGLSLDDMEPQVRLAHELLKKGIPKPKIAFALCRVGDSHLELSEAQSYVADAGYLVLAGSIPEKIAYRRAADAGCSLTETRFPSLNERADRLAEFVQAWMCRTPYSQAGDWVFPSFKLKGKQPRVANMLVEDHLRPAAVRAGVLQESARVRFGFHTLRHTLASFLVRSKTDPKTVQALLRHSDVKTTLQLYAHSVSADRMTAQGEMLHAILGGKSAENGLRAD